MRRTLRDLCVVGACALTVLSLSACGARTVAVDDYWIAGGDKDYCEKLVSELPGEVATQGRRVVEPTASHVEKYSAVWGSPVISLRCGDSAPADFVPADGDILVNGITWSPQKLTHGYRFYCKSIAMPLSVTVPSEYAPETGALADIAETLGHYVIIEP